MEKHSERKNATTTTELRHTFKLLLVSFIPLPITTPSRTKTHPTGVSSLASASSAYIYGVRERQKSAKACEILAFSRHTILMASRIKPSCSLMFPVIFITLAVRGQGKITSHGGFPS
jgi:hypothetical protein